MTPTTVLALLFALGAGLVAHELCHAVVLRAAGVPYDIEWFPGRDEGGLAAGLLGGWAVVEPRPDAEAPAWPLRLSALMPLAMVAPLALVPAGVVADPFARAGVVRVAVVGWMACALPSPRDFSVLWYAEAAIESVVDASGDTDLAEGVRTADRSEGIADSPADVGERGH